MNLRECSNGENFIIKYHPIQDICAFVFIHAPFLITETIRLH